MVWARQVMRAERIQAEIMIEVAPDSMDVIRIVLCIVVLDHECGALDAIVVRLAGLTAAGPCEVDIVEPRSSQFRQLLVSEFLPQAMRVDLDQVGQHFLLFLHHLTQRNADWRFRLNPPGSARNDICGGRHIDQNFLAGCTVKVFSNARPISSSAASTRVPFCGPSATVAGLAPKNNGVVLTT